MNNEYICIYVFYHPICTTACGPLAFRFQVKYGTELSNGFTEILHFKKKKMVIIIPTIKCR